MSVRTVGIGHQDFEQLIQRNYFYIDKTEFIRQWWENGNVVTPITRPRRLAVGFDAGKKPSEEAEPEKFYRGFVLGLMVNLADWYVIISNRESGFGRYDVQMGKYSQFYQRTGVDYGHIYANIMQLKSTGGLGR